MDRRKIGFDIDGVLYDWHNIVVNELIGEDKLEKGTTIADFFNVPDGIIHRWHKVDQDRLTHNPMYYIRPFLMEGAKETLLELSMIHRLERVSLEIFYVTSRPIEIADATKAWVRGMGLPFRDNVYVVDGGKKATVELLGLDYFVEDRPKHIEELKDITTVFVYDRPWNKDVKVFRLNRIFKLTQLIKYFEGYI